MTLRSALGCDTMEELNHWYDNQIDMADAEDKAILELIKKCERYYPQNFDMDRLKILKRLSVEMMKDNIEYIDQCFDDRKEDLPKE